jgi:hypothetical protein
MRGCPEAVNLSIRIETGLKIGQSPLCHAGRGSPKEAAASEVPMLFHSDREWLATFLESKITLVQVAFCDVMRHLVTSLAFSCRSVTSIECLRFNRFPYAPLISVRF